MSPNGYSGKKHQITIYVPLQTYVEMSKISIFFHISHHSPFYTKVLRRPRIIRGKTIHLLEQVP